jgi:hypothetical protein
MLDLGNANHHRVEPPERTVRQKENATRHAERPRVIPRGSEQIRSAARPSLPAGRLAVMTQRPLPAYQPPPINSFSDRVTAKCNHSFTFNAGIGNNRSAATRTSPPARIKNQFQLR